MGNNVTLGAGSGAWAAGLGLGNLLYHKPSKSFGWLAYAGAVDKLALRRKQIDQQRARSMAQKLVSSAITMQLSQLEDNGLTELPTSSSWSWACSDLGFVSGPWPTVNCSGSCRGPS